MMTVRSSDDKVPSLRLPVAIRSISPEGVGVSLGNERCTLERRTTVMVNFVVEGHKFEIPGQIVWVAGSKAPRGPLDIGVRFTLAAVPNEIRQAYARWIVDFLRRRGVQATPPSRS